LSLLDQAIAYGGGRVIETEVRAMLGSVGGDLALAPDPRAGLEMVLLRALAFRPAEGALQPPAAGADRSAAVRAAPARPTGSAAGPARGPESGGSSAIGGDPAAGAPAEPPVRDRSGPQPTGPRPAQQMNSPVRPGPAPLLTGTADWHALVDRLGVGGIASQLAHHCGFIGLGEGRLTLNLDPTAEQLRSPGTEERLRAALESVLGGPLRLEIQVVRPNDETPAQRRTREQDERVQSAQTALAADPAATRLRDQFDGQWVPGSIEPLD
jgi:DNA polymerase-3 subunit gamma/tau